MGSYALTVPFIAVMMLWLNAGYAIESGPSNTVGYWKLDVQPGFTQMSFPLLPNDKSLDNVLGDQLTGGTSPEESDQILRWDAQHARYQMAWYDTDAGHWTGDFNQVTESESYWIYVQPDHPALQTIITYGNVVEDPVYDMGEMTPGYNAVGSVWAVPAPLAQSGLNGFQGGMYLFLSDLVLTYDSSIGGFVYAWKDAADEWRGDLTAFEPLKGYWIYIAPGHDGFDWSDYPQPNPVGLDGRMPLLIYPNYNNNSNNLPPLPPKMQSRTKQPVSPVGGKGGAR